MELVKWLKAQEGKFAAVLAAIVGALFVYCLGRHNRKGELNMAVAQHELDVAMQKHQELTAQITVAAAKRQEIVADIMAEETAKAMLVKDINQSTPEAQIIDILRRDKLIK